MFTEAAQSISVQKSRAAAAAASIVRRRPGAAASTADHRGPTPPAGRAARAAAVPAPQVRGGLRAAARSSEPESATTVPPPPPPPASSPLRHQHQRSDGCRCCSRWSSMSSSPAPAGEKHTANCLSTRRCSGAAPWSSLSDGGAGSDELTSLAAAVVGLGLGLAAAAARILSDPFRRPVLRGR